jgi:hypothetical protein
MHPRLTSKTVAPACAGSSGRRSDNLPVEITPDDH